jgi:ribosome biogenesis GTPase A
MSENNMNINWFPGHMAKAKRELKENLKLVDVIIEIVDARIPRSSRNPDFDEIIGDKLHVIVLNKSDLADEKSKIRKDFIAITSKFNQGNAKVAYDEYSILIDKINNDTSLLTLAKVFYEIGFFSLGDKAIEKIVYKNQFYDNILDLELSYKPKSALTVEEEIYFAKIYSSIYFDNSAQEAIFELSKKKNSYQKHDFYNYMLSRAYLETKQYNLAINSVNKTISINPNNINYQIFRVDILTKAKKFKEAKNRLEKIENLK